MQVGIRGGFFSRSIHTNVIDTFRLTNAKEKEAVISKTMSVWDVIVDCFNDGNQRKALGLLFDIVQLENANLSAETSIDQKIANTAKVRDNFTLLKGLIKVGYTIDMSPSSADQLRVFAGQNNRHLVKSPEYELPIHFSQIPAQFRATCPLTSDGRSDRVDDSDNVFNALYSATGMQEKIRHFGALQQLANEENRFRYVCKYELATNKLSLLIDGIELDCMESNYDQATITKICPKSLLFSEIDYDVTQSTMAAT